MGEIRQLRIYCFALRLVGLLKGKGTFIYGAKPVVR